MGHRMISDPHLLFEKNAILYICQSAEDTKLCQNEADRLQCALQDSSSFFDGKNHEYRVFVVNQASVNLAKKTLNNLINWQPTITTIIVSHPQHSNKKVEHAIRWSTSIESKMASLKISVKNYGDMPRVSEMYADLITDCLALPRNNNARLIFFGQNSLTNFDAGDKALPDKAGGFLVFGKGILSMLRLFFTLRRLRNAGVVPILIQPPRNSLSIISWIKKGHQNNGPACHIITVEQHKDFSKELARFVVGTTIET